ncbi:unnamed protein product [Parascedosporium putredinis]|uniref:Uncharacterized protein n=1 Tax=Parascedosporium putredinis TaxID=1442378 RepID=A0A9P1M729_9PEZI|nr:unnamed protein product [Parascedosporium putredinis]CAI7989642.1 unnamed protein product [Parascedosporium putredinis]
MKCCKDAIETGALNALPISLEVVDVSALRMGVMAPTQPNYALFAFASYLLPPAFAAPTRTHHHDEVLRHHPPLGNRRRRCALGLLDTVTSVIGPVAGSVGGAGSGIVRRALGLDNALDPNKLLNIPNAVVPVNIPLEIPVKVPGAGEVTGGLPI